MSFAYSVALFKQALHQYTLYALASHYNIPEIATFKVILIATVTTHVYVLARAADHVQSRNTVWQLMFTV